MQSVTRQQRQQRSNATSITMGGPGLGPVLHNLVKDGVFIGPSPLLECIDGPPAAAKDTAAGVLEPQRSNRAAAFLDAVERICASYLATSASTRSKWYQYEFRAVCEAAVPVAGEIAAHALASSPSSSVAPMRAPGPVTVPTFLEYVACHVSLRTKEKVQTLQFIARMVASSHAAPSSRATAGTPVARPPTGNSFPDAPAGFEPRTSADDASIITARTSRRERSPAPPNSATIGQPTQQVASSDIHDGVGGASRRQPQSSDGTLPPRRRQPSAEPTGGGGEGKSVRQMTTDKKNIIMPWTIEAPFSHGVTLQRVHPKTFRPNAQRLAAMTNTPTVQDIIAAVESSSVFDLWFKRESSLVDMTSRGTKKGQHHSATAGDGLRPSRSASGDLFATAHVATEEHALPDEAGARKNDESASEATASSAQHQQQPPRPGPVFPHVAAHRNGLGGPSGIGDEGLSATPVHHTTVRKSFLVALAHYGVHACVRGGNAGAGQAVPGVPAGANGLEVPH